MGLENRSRSVKIEQLAGREREVEALRTLWSRVREKGEGIPHRNRGPNGQSRLLQEISIIARNEGVLVAYAKPRKIARARSLSCEIVPRTSW